MEPSDFIIQLKNALPENNLPWVTTALRQDGCIWDCLQLPELNQKLFQQDSSKPETWSPANLSLTALLGEAPDAGVPAERLRQDLQFPVEAGLRRRAAHAFESFASHQPSRITGRTTPIEDPLFRITQAALLALALRERRRLLGSWDGLAGELKRSLPSSQVEFGLASQTVLLNGSGGPDTTADLVEDWGTPLACLYGMVPDPLELLRALLPPGSPSEQHRLVLHILLSNPVHPEKLEEQIRAMLAGLSLEDGVTLLSGLNEQRPNLSARLAQDLINLRCGQCQEQKHPQPGIPHQAEPADYLLHVNRQILEASAHRLARQSIPALAHLNAAWEAAYRLQACLSARQAQILEESGDLELSLPAWKQAVELAPGNTDYISAQARSLIKAGRTEEAGSILFAQPPADEEIRAHPGLKLASAVLAASQPNTEAALNEASEALSAYETAASHDGLVDLLDLTHLLLELGSPAEAARAARLGLKSHPSEERLLALLGEAQFKLGRMDEAAQSTRLAAVIDPSILDLRRQLAVSLEASTAWNQALPERAAVIELSGENPAQEDLHALALCALLSGEANQAASACRRAIETNTEDGAAHSMLGRALKLMGDPQGAQEHYFVATQFSPELPEPWLALAEIQKEAGMTLKGLETLRAGALASSNSPEIFLALGEAYLEDWEGRGHPAFTQALSMLQSASTLAAGASNALSARISLKLGETLQQLGHLADAKQVLAAAYQERPNFPGLAAIYVKTLTGCGDYTAAVPVLRHLLEEQPEDAPTSLELARALVTLQKSPDEAIRCLDYVLTTEYSTSEAQALLAEALSLHGDYSSALQAYQSALETELVSDPAWCSRLSLGLGRTALALNQPEIAIASLEEAAQADPQNYHITRTLCSAYQAAGLDGDALQAARLALRLAPDDVDTLIWFAETVVQMPSSDPSQINAEALNAFSRAAALAPGKPGLLLRQGKVQLLAGDSSAAESTFRQLASEEKASVEELRQAALYLLDLSDAPGAVACLEKALHMSGSSAYEASGPDGIPLALINAYNRTSNPQAALVVLEQTLDRSPADPALLKLKADLLVELGRPTEALSCVQEAVALDPRSEWIPELHLQAARISRGMGKLSSALEHVEAVLAREEPTIPGSHYLAARALAASLARSMLMNDRAQAFLGAPPVLPECEEEDIPLPGWYDYECLRAELALDSGDMINAPLALEAAACYSEISGVQPRLHAIRSRLEAARGQREAALFSLNQALTQAGEATAANTAVDLACLSKAALDLSQWDPAVYLARQAVDAAPAEPYFHTCLANAILLRAESQVLAQSAELLSHAPGASALSDYSRGLFEGALEKAASCLPGNSSIPTLARMKARGLAIFSPGQAAIQALAAVSVYPLAPEDAAAQIAALRTSYNAETISPAHSPSASPATMALQASRSFPQHPLVLAHLAAAMKSTGQHNPEAFSAAQEAIKSLAAGENEGKAWVLASLGEQPEAILEALNASAALGSGDFDTALASIDRSLNIWPEEPRWHALAAQIHSQRRDYDEAVEHLEQSCRLEPSNFRHFLNLGSALLSVPIEDPELSERAINAFEKAADLAPDSPNAWMLLAEAYCQAGLLPKAASCCERSITLSPDQPAPLILRAEIALQAGDPQEAYDRLQAAITLSAETEIIPDLHPILLLSRALDSLDRSAEALTALEKALPRAAEPLPLLLERVHLLRRSQGLPAAVTALRELGEKYPEEPVVLAYLAKAYAETGENEAAIACAQHALQSCANPEVLLIIDSNEQARMHLLLGKLLRQSGQLDQSLYHLNEAIIKDPRLLEPYLELGRVLQERRQLNQALQIYNRATAVAPKDPRPYFQAGLALKESKDYVGAEAMLRRAASLAPNDLGIHRQLGAVVALNLVHNRRRSAMDL